MRVREYQPEDLQALVDIYLRQTFDYRFPDLDELPSKLVLEEAGRVRMAVLARPTAEIYLLMDKRRGSAEERWQQFQQLHRASESDLLRRGFMDAHCWLPPELASRFGRRLESLGWVKDDSWTPYCKQLVADREPAVESEA